MNLFEGSIQDQVVVKGTAAAAGKGDFSDSETLHKFTVPTVTRWWFLGGSVVIDVNATLVVTILNAAGVIIRRLVLKAASTGAFAVPYQDNANTGVEVVSYPIPLKAGYEISFEFGAQQAATAACIIHYIECGAHE